MRSRPKRTPWLVHYRLGSVILASLIVGLPLSAIAQFRHERPRFFEQGRDRFEQELNNFQKPQSVPTLDIDIESNRWSAVLLRKGEAVVWMPQGTTTHETQTVEGETGTINFDVISSHSSLGKFVIAFSDSIDEIAQSDSNELLERVRNHIVDQQSGFSADDDSNITFKNYPGRDFTLSSEKEIITFRVLLVNSRLYIMAVNQSTESQEQEAIATFFQSFQLFDQ